MDRHTVGIRSTGLELGSDTLLLCIRNWSEGAPPTKCVYKTLLERFTARPILSELSRGADQREIFELG
jgi:hypothetical protein